MLPRQQHYLVYCFTTHLWRTSEVPVRLPESLSALSVLSVACTSQLQGSVRIRGGRTGYTLPLTSSITHGASLGDEEDIWRAVRASDASDSCSGWSVYEIYGYSDVMSLTSRKLPSSSARITDSVSSSSTSGTVRAFLTAVGSERGFHHLPGKSVSAVSLHSIR